MQESIKVSGDLFDALFRLRLETDEAIIALKNIEDNEGVQVFVSEQWPDITGYPREELLGSCFFDLLAPDERQIAIQRYRHRMSGLPAQNPHKIHITDKAGALHRIDYSDICPTYQGEKINIMHIHTQNRAEPVSEAQREANERYCSLFDNLPIAIWEINYSLRKKYMDNLNAEGVSDFCQYFKENPGDMDTWYSLRSTIKINNSVLSLFEVQSELELLNLFRLIKIQEKGVNAYINIFNELFKGATNCAYISHMPTFRGAWKYLHVDHCIAPDMKKRGQGCSLPSLISPTAFISRKSLSSTKTT
jgi:PAS domain S-box-containing protein